MIRNTFLDDVPHLRRSGLTRSLIPALTRWAIGNGAAPPLQAAVVPVETVRKFLEAQNVMPTSGRSGADAAKASLVRVICVRR